MMEIVLREDIGLFWYVLANEVTYCINIKFNFSIFQKSNSVVDRLNLKALQYQNMHKIHSNLNDMHHTRGNCTTNCCI